MPIITGEITWHGAIVGVMVGIGEARRSRLEAMGFPVPQAVQLRAEIDTGSAVTAFLPAAFQQLAIGPFGKMPIRTPSTTPDSPVLCDQYDVTLYFASGMDISPFPNVHAIASEDFQADEEAQGIIGRDVLALCNLEYWGRAKQFRLSF